MLTSAQRLAAAYVPPLLTAIALLALLGWALHVCKLLEQYHRFALLQNGTALATQSGLIVKRRHVVPPCRAQRFYHAANAAAFVHPPGSSRRAVCGPYRRAWGGNSFDARLSRLWSKNLISSLQGFCPEITVHIPPKEGWRAYLPAFAQVCVLAGVGVFMITFSPAHLCARFSGCAPFFCPS